MLLSLGMAYLQFFSWKKDIESILTDPISRVPVGANKATSTRPLFIGENASGDGRRRKKRGPELQNAKTGISVRFSVWQVGMKKFGGKHIFGGICTTDVEFRIQPNLIESSTSRGQLFTLFYMHFFE